MCWWVPEERRPQPARPSPGCRGREDRYGWRWSGVWRRGFWSSSLRLGGGHRGPREPSQGTEERQPRTRDTADPRPWAFLLAGLCSPDVGRRRLDCPRVGVLPAQSGGGHGRRLSWWEGVEGSCRERLGRGGDCGPGFLNRCSDGKLGSEPRPSKFRIPEGEHL